MTSHWRFPSRAWLPIGLVVASLLVTATMAAGRRAIEQTTLERYQVERRALANQGARQLEVSFDSVRRRLADPALRAFSGVERAHTAEEIAAALRILAGDIPTDQVVFFAHDRDGHLVAVDPAVEPEMAHKMLAHHHENEAGTWLEGAGVCPMCAAEQHAASIVQPLSAPLGDRLFLAANVRLDRVGADALSALTLGGQSSVCVQSRTGRPIACRGQVHGETLGTNVPLRAYPLAVNAATERVAVVGEVRRHALGMFTASAAALLVLGAAAGFALWRERQRGREENAATARLAEVDKLASLGTMAAGVMHEIASPLAAVRANVEVLEQMTPEELPDVRREALDGINRIQRIAEDLRRFSRRAETAIEQFDIREPVETAVRLAAPATKYVCRVDVRLPEPVWVRGNAQHVAQIVLNLVSNAAHALRGRGLAGARIIVSVRSAGARVELQVEDSGPGVPPEDVPKLFSLFFTTKPAGEGTGLGLALSARMATEDGGRLRYEPASPGARFVLELPRAA